MTVLFRLPRNKRIYSMKYISTVIANLMFSQVHKKVTSDGKHLDV